MSEGQGQIRSYQRIFSPRRRIYQVEGRALPVPGGVSLRWLAYVSAALLAVLLLSSGEGAVMVAIALAAALGGGLSGGRAAAVVAGVVALAGAWLTGFALGLLDWPLRLLMVPGAVATLATQATPDGRRADRFAASWLAVRLAPRRRSLDRRLPLLGATYGSGAELWVAPDRHSPLLRRARVHGSALVGFNVPVELRRATLRRGRLVASPAKGQGDLAPARLALGDGEVLEVRP